MLTIESTIQFYHLQNKTLFSHCRAKFNLADIVNLVGAVNHVKSVVRFYRITLTVAIFATVVGDALD